MAPTAEHALEVLAVPVGAVAVAALARRVGIAAPLLLVVAGLVVSAIPGVPHLVLDPDFVLQVFMPPLLFSAAWGSSYYNLRDNLRPIFLLSVGLVLFTTVVIGYTASWLIPGLPLAAGFVLGAIVAPPDAVAAVSIARRLGLPRRVVTILVGESLFNDATALTVFAVAVAAATGEHVSTLGGIGRFCYSALAGAAVGLVLGPALHWLRGRLDADPVVETAIVLLAPFAAYLLAEIIHASGVMAVVVAGLYLGYRFTDRPGTTRLLGTTTWKVLVFMLESVVFLLIGLQLRTVVSGVSDVGAGRLALYAVGIFLAAVLARFVWIFPSGYLPWLLSPRLRSGERGQGMNWRSRVAISWAGMRGVVSLAAAFAIPFDLRSGAPFPDRDLLLFLTFTTVLGSLLVQGLTFPGLIRWMRVGSEREQQSDLVAEAGAKHAAANAAAERLAQIAAEADDPAIVAKLHKMTEHRQVHAWERLGGGTGMGGSEVPSATYRRLRLEMIDAERRSAIGQRDDRSIDDEVLGRILRELDLEEASLTFDPYAEG